MSTHNAFGTWSLTDSTGRLWQFIVTGSPSTLSLAFKDGGVATGSYNPQTGNGTTYNIYNQVFDTFNVTNSTWTWGKYGTYTLTESGPVRTYIDLGCWKDNYTRAIPGGYVGTPGTDAYTVEKCYDHAVSKGHNIFALQAQFACFTGIEMRDNYKLHGEASGTCGPTGDSWVNHVYKITTSNAITPHSVPQYSDWSAVRTLFSDFQTQASNLVDSLSTIDTSNPAPYMTSMDTDVNAIRDAALIQRLKVQNSENIDSATKAFKTAADISGPIQQSKDDAEKLRREISLSAGQNAGFEKNILPLQILAATLVGALIIHFVAGAFLPATTASTLVLVGLASGFGAAVYFAINKQS